MYAQRPSDSPLIRLVWRVEVDADGAWQDVADEYWGLAFSRRGAGPVTAQLVAPTLVPRRFELRAGDLGWGVDLHAHVFWRGQARRIADGRHGGGVLDLPTDGAFFTLAGVRYPVPAYDELETTVAALVRQGVLVADPLVGAALAGDDAPASERTLQRAFRATTGLRRVQITQLRRARHAYRLLQDGVSVAEAAATAGYADQAHLTRALRGFAGMTPARILARGPVGNVQDPGDGPAPDFSP